MAKDANIEKRLEDGYSLKHKNTDYYFANSSKESFMLEHLIREYPSEWKEALQKSWVEFLGYCAILLKDDLFTGDLKQRHDIEMPKDFAPLIDYYIIMAVKRFDEDCLSKKGYYLFDRAGHGYDLGVLQSLGMNWVEDFYNCL